MWVMEEHGDRIESEGYRACPHCTIQVPGDAKQCPHCERAIAVGGGPPERGFGPFGKKRIDRTRILTLAAVNPIMVLLLVVIVNLYRHTAGVRIEIDKGYGITITHVEIVHSRNGRIIRGEVRNDLENVPSISLKSVGVRSEMVMENGNTYMKTLFPVGPLGEPGALLKGEGGIFELTLPQKGVRKVKLHPGIIDLRGGGGI